MQTIDIHEDNTPLEKMNKTPALLALIKLVRAGDLDLESESNVGAAAKACSATDEDLRNLQQFFDECEDTFALVDLASGN